MIRGTVVTFVICVMLGVFLFMIGGLIIKKADPLAQQISVLDHCAAKDVIPIKGELMRDLIVSYYKNKERCKCECDSTSIKPGGKE